MIGIKFGCQNTVICYGKIKDSSKNKNILNILDFENTILINEQGNRNLASIIQFKETNRLYGENTILEIRKYYLSSFQNLPRLIGFNYDLKINEKETKYFITNENYDKENNLFYFEHNNKKIKLKGDFIVNAYMSFLKNYIFLKSQITTHHLIVITVPDYFTLYQKETFKLINKSIGLEDSLIINESTALNIQYGFSNYANFFYENNDEKYVIFIDSGYSKTSFILSKFTESNFEVIDIDNIIFLGGRDFNNKIYKHLLENFQKENNIELKENGRLKLRLMESIEKARKNLTCNKEINIYIESFYEDYDLNYLLKKEEFEKLIEEELIIFKTRFQKFWNKFKQKNKLYKIEIAGQLMGTPILQNIVFELTQIPISKTIIIDECLSIGAFYYAVFSCEKKQFEKVQLINSYNMYTINYSIENSQKYPFILKGELIPNKNKIFLGDILNISNKDEITIDFDYDENDIQDIGFKDYNICSFTIDIFNLKKKAENQKKFFLEYEIHEDNSFDIQLFYKNNNNKNIYLNQYLKRKEKGLFLNQNEKDKILEEFTKNENEFGSIDDNFDKFLTKKNEVENKLYSIKNNIKNNEDLLKKFELLERTLTKTKNIESIQKIEEEIHSLSKQQNNK